MTVQSISGVVEAAIQRASRATGVDFGFLMRTAKRESGFNPGIHARTSSAAGLFQFVDQTWLSMLKQHGAKYGYGNYADMIQRGSDGRYHVTGGAEARTSVMNLKLDPSAAAYMGAELASECSAYLRGRIGREPTSGEVYVAHMLGPQGGAKLIEAVQTSPGADAAAMFPEAAGANKPIFYPGGRPASVAQVYANLTSNRGGAAPVVTTPTTAPDPGLIEFASARRVMQMQEEQALIGMLLHTPDGSGESSLGLQASNSLFSNEMLQALAETPKV
jgi:hypothetical protein